MFRQSNARMNRIMKGEIKVEEIAAAQREFEGQIKLINSIVSAFGIMSKTKRARAGLERMNLLDDTTAIDLGLGDPGLDKVRCAEQGGNLISRDECLDYSGNPGHYEDCKVCINFSKSREKLVGPALHMA